MWLPDIQWVYHSRVFDVCHCIITPFIQPPENRNFLQPWFLWGMLFSKNCQSNILSSNSFPVMGSAFFQHPRGAGTIEPGVCTSHFSSSGTARRSVELLNCFYFIFNCVTSSFLFLTIFYVFLMSVFFSSRTAWKSLGPQVQFFFANLLPPFVFMHVALHPSWVSQKSSQIKLIMLANRHHISSSPSVLLCFCPFWSGHGIEDYVEDFEAADHTRPSPRDRYLCPRNFECKFGLSSIDMPQIVIEWVEIELEGKRKKNSRFFKFI